MRRGRVKLTMIVLAVLLVVLGVAWFDGGRVEERLIEQRVELGDPRGYIAADLAGPGLADGESVR